MIALHLREYLQSKTKGATIVEICQQFDMTEFIARQFLNSWERAGKVQKVSFGGCCSTKSNCPSCVVSNMEVYCWRSEL